MWADNANVDQETANLEFAVATINRLRPTFVVVTGDLVNRAADDAQVSAYLRVMGKVDRAIPVYNMPGNHDVGNAPTPESLAAYVKRFGPDHYAFRHGNLAGIVLDSVLMFAPEKVPEAAAEQDRWLRAELERARRDAVTHIVVFQHHPFFVKDPAEADAYENIPRERRVRYLALLAEFGVKEVFAGHYHRDAIAWAPVSRQGQGAQARPSDARTSDVRRSQVQPGIEMVTTGPIGKPLGEGAKSGMRIVTVSESGVEHRYCDLGDLPNRVVIKSP
jgi:3',5'-cyclic AMP phosphodiesterase CpdA